MKEVLLFVKMFSFKEIIVSRGYHVYKEASWFNAKINEKVKVELKTDAKSLQLCYKSETFILYRMKNSGTYIPCAISRYVYFFVKEENGKVFGRLKSLKYKISPIPSGGLEVPLSLTFNVGTCG